MPLRKEKKKKRVTFPVGSPISSCLKALHSAVLRGRPTAVHMRRPRHFCSLGCNVPRCRSYLALSEESANRPGASSFHGLLTRYK